MMAPRAEAAGGNQSHIVATSKQFYDYSTWFLLLFFEKAVVYIATSQSKTKDGNNLYSVVFLALLIASILLDGLLLLVSHRMQLLERINERLYTAANILIYLTSILAMATSFSLLLLLNTSYYILTILLLLVISVVGIAFYKRISTGRQAREVTCYEAHQSELKQIFGLSKSITSVAFQGMVVTVFSYTDQNNVKLSEALNFFTVILGFLAMLLAIDPPSLHHTTAKARFISFIKVLSYALCGLLELTDLAVAAEFVDGRFILLASSPIFFTVIVWFSKEFMQDNPTNPSSNATSHENEPDTLSINITMSIFAAMKIIFSRNFSPTGDYGFLLKTCMLFMSIAFVSSLSWMVLGFRPQSIKEPAGFVKILFYFTIGCFVLAMLDLVFSEIRRS